MSKLTDPVYESVRVNLTQQEVLDFGQRLAQATKDKEEIEKRKKQIMDDLKAQISRADADIQIFGSRVRDKYEYRDVECHWDLDHSENPPKRKHLVRQDTFETVRVSVLTAEDIVEISQFKLPIKD